MTTKKETATPPQDGDLVGALDSLSSDSVGSKPYRMGKFSEEVRSAIVRAYARGITVGTITTQLRARGERIEAKTVRAWLQSPDIARLVEEAKEREAH